MTLSKLVLGAGLAILLGACSNTVATRNASFDKTMEAAIAEQPLVARLADEGMSGFEPGQSPVTVSEVNVTVPQSLKVSEANSYFPKGDIVWRGEPIGDRRAQVKKLVQDALDQGVADLDGPIKVILDVEVVKFHALSQKARYTVGGIHNLEFIISVREVDSGKVIMPARVLRSDLKAYGGQRALNAEAAGQTQAVRISDHLARVINEEMTNPEGHQNAHLGLVQMMHNL